MNKTYINYLVNECLEIAMDQKLIKRPKTFEKKLAVTFHSRRGNWGGVCRYGNPIVTFGLARNGRFHPGVTHFVEYARIRKSKYIGEFYSKTPSLIYKAVIAHEMAHAIKHWNGLPGKPHGFEWRAIYRAIREVWVNPFIDWSLPPTPNKPAEWHSNRITAFDQYLNFGDH